MAAQNQHYVPKFVLRHFLAGGAGERVHVYDKHTDRSFVTSIRNVMAERRFNDFAFNDNYIASFEPIACAAEEQVLPAYRQVLQERRLSDDPEQKAALAVFLAFQLLRTKAHRDQWQVMEDELVRKVEASGGRMQDIKGWQDWQPATEDSLKREHLAGVQAHIGELTKIIATKDFLLAEPASGASFYLGDHPVVRANSRDYGPFGNLGLALEGIEIYMPLAADLMLCAWCPSIIRGIEAELLRGREERRSEALRAVMQGRMDASGMKRLLDDFAALTRPQEELLARAAGGRPMDSCERNMEYYNSLQVRWAHRYVISGDGNFGFARRVNRASPEFRKGPQVRIA